MENEKKFKLDLEFTHKEWLEIADATYDGGLFVGNKGALSSDQTDGWETGIMRIDISRKIRDYLQHNHLPKE